MKFKLGEFVRFVDERREGYITRIINDTTVAVTDDDGFEIPVLANQVTRVHGKSSETDPDTDREIKPEPDVQFESNGIFLALADDKRTGLVVHFHLINLSSYQLLITLCTEKKQKIKGEFAGIVQPGSSVQICSASLNELDLWPVFISRSYYIAQGIRHLKSLCKFQKNSKQKTFQGLKSKQP